MTVQQLKDDLTNLYNNHINSWFFIIKHPEYAEHIKMINELTPLLQSNEYTLKTKIYWVLNDITEFPKCHTCGASLEHYNVVSLGNEKIGYQKHNGTCIGYRNCNNCKCKQSQKAKIARFARLEKSAINRNAMMNNDNIYYYPEKIHEWALNFKNEHGRRPTKGDFQAYTGRKFPRRDLNKIKDYSVFDLWDSYLELKVIDYLKCIGCEEMYITEYCTNKNQFVRNKMFMDNTGKHHQIDIFFPLLQIGYEVQDFTTHSKDSDTEKYSQRENQYKHGPTYHKHKIAKANELGISIYELWEDDIRNDEFKTKLASTLCQHI